ncbi:hypothetical protein [Cryptosporangium aurantiacum]|uniref:Uncharacterized protein n=1 Tax=Cryptosporangium aurantiacum TaxID=134849 RepID=A0A1M7PT89_9ACTN|nr:hypothetical protein [Cryptosporangium aurantiacum]SHN20536.1 hypothetical protein SAMN05443668_103650 [Cryptosporangium aurantiacum]
MATWEVECDAAGTPQLLEEDADGNLHCPACRTEVSVAARPVGEALAEYLRQVRPELPTVSPSS